MAVAVGLLLASVLPLGFQAGAALGNGLAAWTGLPRSAAALGGSAVIAAVGLLAALVVYLLIARQRHALVRALEDLRQARAVTDEEIARRAFAEAESRLRAIANVAPDLVWSKPVDGPVDFFNRGWFEFTGVDPVVDGQVDWESLVHPDDRAAVLAAQARIEAGEAMGDLELRLRHRSGEYRALLARTASGLEDEQGRVTRLIGTLTDIQALVDSRAAAAAALADAEAHKAHLRLILESIPDAMVVTDAEGTIQSFSAAAEAMFGWKEAEVVGRNVNMLMPDPYRSAHDAYMARHITTGETHLMAGRVLVGQRRGGETFPFEMSLGGHTWSGRRFFTSFLRDLSERRATEKRLQQLQGELTHVSRLSAMGEMAAGIAHELNQPLMAAASYIQGSNRLLQRDKVATPDVIDAMGEASREILRAGEIIRRIRRFLAPGPVERRPEDVEAMLREAVALAMVGAKDSGISLRYRMARDLPKAMVDRVQVQQVVVNLVRNAAEAMAQSPRRELTISASLNGAGQIEVTVADTGSGLDPKVANQLFHPFVTAKAAGMGLGLSISRTIIEAQGGRIWVRRRAGGGTAFRFTIPPVETERSENASAT